MITDITEIQVKAIQAVRRAVEEDRRGLPGGVRMRALKHLRDTTGCTLRDGVPAVKWAWEQLRVDPSKYLVDAGRHPAPYWDYRFPNGYKASVIPDPHLRERPFTFEVVTDAIEDQGRGGVTAGLTSDEVIAKLAAIANLPTPEPGEEKPVDITPSVFQGAPPVRTYADGSQTYGPYSERERLARHLYIEAGSLDADAAKRWDVGLVSESKKDYWRAAADRAFGAMAGTGE